MESGGFGKLPMYHLCPLVPRTCIAVQDGINAQCTTHDAESRWTDLCRWSADETIEGGRSAVLSISQCVLSFFFLHLKQQQWHWHYFLLPPAMARNTPRYADIIGSALHCRSREVELPRPDGHCSRLSGACLSKVRVFLRNTLDRTEQSATCTIFG